MSKSVAFMEQGREKMKPQEFEHAVASVPDPGQISPQQRRFEEIARERGFSGSSEIRSGTAAEIMEQVRREMNGQRSGGPVRDRNFG